MDKLNYLRRVFAHTKGKTFENYVINQIWTKVEDLGLYPVTQQYVKRPNGYALIDLYFPQITFAIEVNENYHNHIIESDKMRMEDIFGSIPEIDIESIKEENYESVKKQIKDVVKKIENKVNEFGSLKWDENWKETEYEKKLSLARKNSKLCVSDSIGFKMIQVTNDIFNKGYSEGYLRWGNVFFKKSDNEYIWFPRLISYKDWENTISDDWNQINEKYIGEKILLKPENDESLDKNIIRYTFAKYKDSLGEVSYRFIGIFKIIDAFNNTRIYNRISTEMKL
jgi:hypothetical protein